MKQPTLSDCLIVLKCTVETRDMSVGHKETERMTQDADGLAAGQEIDASPIGMGRVKVIAISPESVTVECEGETLTAELGQSVDGRPHSAGNIYVSASRRFTLEYAEKVSYQLVEELVAIMNIHEKTTLFPCRQTEERQRQVLEVIDRLIGEGRVQLYPLKALLVSTDNWQKAVIERMDTFRQVLLEGLEKGCLEPDSDGWEWLHYVADDNNPSDFFEDSGQFGKLLDAAVQAGNDSAVQIVERMEELKLIERHEALSRLIEEIGDAHEQGTPLPDEAARKMMAFDMIDTFITEGEKGFYPLKALLSSVDNWSNGMPFRDEVFRCILMEGIDDGALAPDDSRGWSYMKTAADYFDPLEYREYKRLLDDLLEKAIKAGNNNACQIKSLLEKDFTEQFH